MITDSAQLDLVFEFIVTENFSADSVQPRIDDFCNFDTFFVSSYTCNAFGKTFHQLFGIVIENWGKYVDGW